MPNLEGPDIDADKSSSLSSVSSRERDDDSIISGGALSPGPPSPEIPELPGIIEQPRVRGRVQLPIYEQIIIPQEPSLDELLVCKL